MDIRKTVEDLAGKITADKDLAAKFQANPTGTVEGLLGINLPDDQINALVSGLKAKLNLDSLGGALGGLGKLFGK